MREHIIALFVLSGGMACSVVSGLDDFALSSGSSNTGGASMGGGGTTSSGGGGSTSSLSSSSSTGTAGGGGSCDIAGGEAEDPAGHHCYRFIDAGLSWDNARQACMALGGDLAAVSTPQEQVFLQALAPKDVWIGGTDSDDECSFHWTNGEPWAPFWEIGEPNNVGDEDCVQLRDNGKFNDQNCSSARQYLCERTPAGFCGDGIVQPNEECDDANVAPGVVCNQCNLECDPGEFKDPTDLHCYQLITSKKDWQGARDDCISRGAVLAVITSTSEQTFLQPYLMSDTWLDGRLINGNWRWQNNERWCYENWALNEPSANVDELCLELYADGSWNNETCTLMGDYLCERAPLGNIAK